MAAENDISPNRVTFENIAERAQEIREMLGEAVFGRLMYGYSRYSKANGLPEHIQREASAHPFAVAWYKIHEDAKKSLETKSMQITEQSIFLVDLGYSLYVLKESCHFESMTAKLIGKGQYASTAFEAFIYAMYAWWFKQPIEVIPESRNKGERRPDFLVNFENGRSVYIECKSMLDDVRVEEVFWSNVQVAIAQILDKSPDSYAIDIRADKRLTAKIGIDLVFIATDLIDNFPVLTRGDIDGFTVRIWKIMERGESLEFPLNFGPHQPKSAFMFGADFYAMPVQDTDAVQAAAARVWRVDVHPFADPMQSDRAITLIKDAADQIPEGSPGVVHLQIPYRDSEHFQSVLDQMRGSIERELIKRPHICVVVITGRFLNKEDDRKTGSDPIMTFHSVIPNYGAKYTLPSDFTLLGSHPNMTGPGDAVLVENFQMPAESEISLKFGISKAFSEQAGRHLVQFCSKDGRHQLNIWQHFSGQSRIESWHEGSGHHILDVDLNHIKIGELNTMALGWDKSGIRFVINEGQELRSSAKES